MKRLATLLLVMGALGVAASAFAQGPIAGTYKTLTGTILPGRATESMPADGAEGQLGNMVWAESWSAGVLGTNWKMTCPQISGAPVLVLDAVDSNGNGQRGWQTPYSGGTLWLDGNGAWFNAANPQPFYTGPITSFTATVYKQYVNHVIVGAVTNINLMGTFDGYTNCFAMAISNAELVGMTPGGFPPLLGPFPAFHGPLDCSVIGTHGTWWTVNDVTFSILGTCATTVDGATWGRIKTLYR